MTMAVEAREVTKRFGAAYALAKGHLAVARGEIHALLGANGCGKSTLCKIIAGTHAPTSGTILIGGEPASFASPRDAEARGVALFYQELSLIPQLSVAANIFLGREPRTSVGAVDRGRLHEEAVRLIALFSDVCGNTLTPGARVGALAPDQRQIVEILKVFAKTPRLMLMDEATAALDGRQVGVLFDLLKARRAEGVSTILISHRLDEVFAIADRITVMRNGETVAEVAVAEATPEDVVRMMVGKVHRAPPRQPKPAAMPQPLVEVSKVSGGRLRDVTLSVAPGEILGLGGLQAQGQSALLRGLFGAVPFASGSVRIAGEAVRLRRPAEAVRRGMAYVSGDRVADAVLPGRSIFENLAAATLVRERRLLVGAHRLLPRLSEVAANLRTKFGDMSDAINTLSGGNQQKVFIARWLATSPRVLLLDDPTKGIDLSAKADLFLLMRRLAEAGAAILLYSSEEIELLDNADRVVVFNGGAIVAELSGSTLDAFHLTRAAYGEAS